MRKYGIENFTFEILEEYYKDLLDEREVYYITLYKSNERNYGYNNTNIINKKSVKSVLKESDIISIINHLKNNLLDMQEIADLFNISKSTIKNINIGYTHSLDNEIYPIRDSNWFYKYRHVSGYDIICKQCGTEFHSNESGRLYCSVNCSNESQKGFDWPSQEVLLDFLNDGIIFKDISNRYSVSEASIRKLMKRYGEDFYKECLFLNEKNRILKSKTGLKNVSFAKNKTNPFQVCFCIEGISVSKGCYSNEVEAAKVADYWIKELYKGNAYTNLELGLVNY